jgi:putative DNA primase/helicase
MSAAPAAETRPNMLKAALWYAEHGFPVFPVHSVAGGRCSCGGTECEHVGKHPRTAHGFKDATTDSDTIKEWWGEWPEANIGMPTGAVTGLLVIDIDPRNGGEESLESLFSKHRRFPDTAEQITGGGGRHIIFRHPGVPTPNTLAPGIDMKGDRGYIVVAPSIHSSGNRYQWDGIGGAKALLSPADLPAWLLEYITAARQGSGAKSEATPGSEKIPKGTRNDHLASLGGTMRKRRMSREAIEAALLEENPFGSDSEGGYRPESQDSS